MKRLGNYFRRWKKIIALGLVTAVAVSCTGGNPLPPVPVLAGEGVNTSPDIVRIGVLTPMTGELATFGELARNGVRLALDEWNEAGGAGGRPVGWVLEDTGCDALIARQAAERLIAGGVTLLVGGVCSESAIAIANVAQAHNVLFVAMAATHPLVTVDGEGAPRPTVFRAAYEYSYQGKAAARFLLEQMKVSQAVVVFDPANAYERALAEAFAQSMVAGGGKVAQVAAAAPEEIDWPSVWRQLQAEESVALYVPGSAGLTEAIARQHKFAYVMGSEAWRRAEGGLAGLEGAYFTDHFDAGVTTEQAADWSHAYETAFAQEPDTLAALGYEAMDVLVQAIDRAGDTTPEAVARQLATAEYSGVMGAWRYDESHNPVKSVVVLRVTQGSARFFSLVAPR